MLCDPWAIFTIQADSCGAQCQGINSSMRFCGQPFTRRVYPSGEDRLVRLTLVSGLKGVLKSAATGADENW